MESYSVNEWVNKECIRQSKGGNASESANERVTNESESEEEEAGQ
jgi:hypothetical protein